ncbi:zinc finger protein 460-like isoform X3 [Homalodisca vitripennis]|uniref:zinc finger protein 460-like isoform X3 n=1 Tax=Homalodisca vitripennis TaxID=197043 RepID=UPI001EE9F145|nr:zinc finger protein 460-like isoform X3 [Homalodisca vitripennis]
MNHIAQYRNGLHHQIHHNPCPPIHNFTGRFPTPNLGPLPDNVMMPQIVTEGIQYHNAPLQPFLTATDNRQQQDDNSVKIPNHRKQVMTPRNFQPVPAPIISTPSCSSRQEPQAKAPDTGPTCTENNYKPPQSATVDNHQFVQHCDQGAKNCVQCYNLAKGEPSGTIIKVMVDAATMTDQDEMDQTGGWSIVSNSSPPANTKVTEYLSSLRQFLKVDHPKITQPHESKKQRQGDIRIVTSADGTRLYFCPECHAAYPDKNLLEPHLAAHKIERRFICNVCGAGLKRKEHLDRHQLSHSEERPYSCAVCAKTFKRNEHLSRHSVIHSGLKAQVCTECGKSFYRRDHLRKHLLGHRFKQFRQRQKEAGSVVVHNGSMSGPNHLLNASNGPLNAVNAAGSSMTADNQFLEKERPWVCGVCGAAHIRKEHLDRHQLTHTDERPYACPLCPKAFKHNEHLSRHLVIHSGHKTQDRPWVCGVCGTGHARKEHLERHQVTHSDLRPYACPACPKTFKRNEHLSRHLVIHSGQKSELCRECGKTFYRKDHLRKHAESHHNKRGKHTLPAMPPAMPPGAAVMPPGAAVMALS